jgi:DNA-binding NarL/FixJ family response regulator
MPVAAAPASAKSTHTRRILIVDDHELVRFGIRQLIEAEPDLEVCGEAPDMPTALRMLRECGPHVAIVDLSLQDGSGLELVKEIKASFPDVIVLVCSLHEEAIFAPRALRAGARGYVHKQQPAKNIVAAIRRILQGGIYLSPAISERMLQEIVGSTVPAESSLAASLTDRELEVFELMGRGLTTRQIAERLYLSPKTIEFHRDKIKQKLNVENTTVLMQRAVAWVLNQG